MKKSWKAGNREKRQNVTKKTNATMNNIASGESGNAAVILDDHANSQGEFHYNSCNGTHFENLLLFLIFCFIYT